MTWQSYVMIAAITSATGCFLIIRTLLNSSVGADSASKVQKLHHHKVLRLGGVPVFIGVTIACLTGLLLHSRLSPTFFGHLWIVMLPAFLVGLLDDCRGGELGTWWRLLTTMAAAGVGYWLLGAHISRIDIGWADALLHESPAVIFVLTLVAGAGIPHAVNMIDGCNGLAAFISILALTGLGIAAHGIHDFDITAVAFSGAGTLLGFLVWNFPYGKLFLGDSGAYFSGFLIAELSMMLVHRHPEISAWFPFTLVIYPVWEALYSSFRRAQHDPRTIMQPDARHLHQLVFRRVARPLFSGESEQGFILANSMSSMPFWACCAAVTALALHFRSDPWMLLLICIAFAIVYMQSYVLLAKTRLRVSRSRVPLREGPPEPEEQSLDGTTQIADISN